MNERIHDLAIQAKDWAYAEHVGFTAQMLFEQKFAELIVQECADWIDRQDETRCPYGVDLVEHFGIEE